jgi:flagellar hook protein FlgE
VLISSAVSRALDDIAVRERDVLQAFVPGATPERADVAKAATFRPAIDPLSVAPPDGAYLMTSDDRGRMLFTRDGTLAIENGTLVDSQGRAMLGYTRDGAALGPLTVDPVDAALGFAASARIESDGSVTYERAAIDPRTGRRDLQRTSAGRVALARFAPGTKLQAVDAQHAAAPLGVVPHIGRPGDGNFGPIIPFAREASGIDIDAGLQRLQEAYLALDAIRAAGSAQGSVAKTTMDLLK